MHPSLHSGRRPLHVIPRRVSAVGPLAFARDDKRERLGVTRRELRMRTEKERLGVTTKERLGVTKKGSGDKKKRGSGR